MLSSQNPKAAPIGLPPRRFLLPPSDFFSPQQSINHLNPSLKNGWVVLPSGVVILFAAVEGFGLCSWKHGFGPQWYLPPFRNKQNIDGDYGRKIAAVRSLEVGDNRQKVAKVLVCIVLTPLLNIGSYGSLKTSLSGRPKLRAAIAKERLRLSASTMPEKKMLWAWAPVFGPGPWFRPGEVFRLVAAMPGGFLAAIGPAEFLFGSGLLKTDYGPCIGVMSIGYLYQFFS